MITNQAMFFTVFALLGGLALFIFGMNVMTEGLRLAAGSRLRQLLGKATRNRGSGIGLGTALGTLIHSSAATVMLVGFTNAGLITLEQSIPVMLGANIGTTLSMQAVSLNLSDYCYFTIAVGFILSMVSPSRKWKHLGRGLMGFGMLFLGMNVMSEAIKPHREFLAPFLAGIDGSSWKGMLTGIGVAAGLTAIWQSSGATIAIIFALVAAGIFTRIEQVFPVVLGAHIGTCATALLGSIGTHIEAKRAAVTHLLFNIFNVTLAAAAHPFFFWLIPLTSGDLTRQTANLHTAVMVFSALILLPLSLVFAKVIRWVTPTRTPPPEPSFLKEDLLVYPEQALMAVIRELQRVVRICSESFHLNTKVLLRKKHRPTIQRIKLNEVAINEVKLATRRFLGELTGHALSRRQTILVQHLDRCMVDIERIGDHIDELCDLSLQRKKIPQALFDEEALEWLFSLYQKADRVLQLVIRSLDYKHNEFQSSARAILEARDHYVTASLDTKSNFSHKILEHQVAPSAAMYYAEYVGVFDKIVRHSKNIALAQSRPEFWIKRQKLDRIVKDDQTIEPPAKIDPKDFLDRLQSEDYL